MTAQSRRDQAVSFLNRSVEVLSSDPGMAGRLIGSSVVVDPGFAEGWFRVGVLAAEAGGVAVAVAAFRRAVQSDPAMAKAWDNLGWQLHDLGELTESGRCSEKALEIDGTLVSAVINLSRLEMQRGNHRKAVSLAERARGMRPDHTSEMQLAFAHLFAGHWAAGLECMEARFSYKLHEFLSYPWPKWAGAPLEGTLYLGSDQGIGDAISFARFVPAAAARCGRVLLGVQPELVRLFGSLLVGCPNVEIVALPCALPEAEAWSTIYGLPHALGLTDAEIEDCPALRCDPFAVPLTWKAPDRRLHVGISWAGNPANGIDKWRSIDAARFLDLCRVPGVALYSLQVGPRAGDINALSGGSLVRDLSPYIRDAADTVGVLAELDLVICAEGSVAHMAALAGKPAWIAYSHMGGDWRCGRARERQLWAPLSRIFAQRPGEDWRPVFERIVEALRALAEGHP